MQEHFRSLDVLRGLAALTVVAFHYHHFYLLDWAGRGRDIPPLEVFPYAAVMGLAYEYGHFAVQLFWVISGFVFAHVYLPRRATAMEFVVARVARLYPLHLVTLVLVAIVQWLSSEVNGHWIIYGNNDLKHFLLQLSFASNSIWVSEGLSFNGPIWSVSLELASYALFFLLLPVIRKLGVIFLLPMVLAFGGCVLLDVQLKPFTQGVFVCALYFFVGNLVYLLYRDAPRFRAPVLIALCVATLIVMWAGSDDEIVTLSWCATVVYAMASINHVVPENVVARFLSDTSYSVYLVHVPLQMLVLLFADTYCAGSRTFADSAITLPVYVLLSVFLAYLAHRYVEKPSRNFIISKMQMK